MDIALLIGITGGLGFMALGVGVFILGKLPHARPASQQVQMRTIHRKEVDMTVV
jgi:hypothetical protein